MSINFKVIITKPDATSIRNPFFVFLRLKTLKYFKNIALQLKNATTFLPIRSTKATNKNCDSCKHRKNNSVFYVDF